MKLIRFVYYTEGEDDFNIGSFFMEGNNVQLYSNEGIFSFKQNEIIHIEFDSNPLWILNSQLNLSLLTRSDHLAPNVSRLSVWTYKEQKRLSLSLIVKDFLKVTSFLTLL